MIETERSKEGKGFVAANNTTIEHYGMRKLKGQGDEFQPLGMIAQVAKVKSTLISVRRMLEAGNRVHFEPGNCYIEHMTTGARTNIIEKNGSYEIGFWVPKLRAKNGDDRLPSKDNQPGFAGQHMSD